MVTEETLSNVFVGGPSGSFKGLSINESSCITNLKKYKIADSRNVNTLSWANDKETEILVACGTKEAQSVEIFERDTSTFKHSFKCSVGEGNIVGVCKSYHTLLIARQSGHVICPKSEEEEESLVVNAGPDLHRMRQSSSEKKIIATGGIENPLKLFDIEHKKQLFTAKNVKPDSLQLRVPVWVSDIGFLPGSSKLVTTSKYGHVRLYDCQAQRRPVINVEIKQEALGSLAVHPTNMQVIVGSGKGRMNLIDLRNAGKVLNSYKGAVGSVTAIAIDKSGRKVASVSLDRIFRIHDVHTKQLLTKQYLFSRATCLIVSSEFGSCWTESKVL